MDTLHKQASHVNPEFERELEALLIKHNFVCVSFLGFFEVGSQLVAAAQKFELSTRLPHYNMVNEWCFDALIGALMSVPSATVLSEFSERRYKKPPTDEMPH